MTTIVLSFARLITKFCGFLNTTNLSGATNVGDLFLIWKSKLAYDKERELYHWGTLTSYASYQTSLYCKKAKLSKAKGAYLFHTYIWFIKTSLRPQISYFLFFGEALLFFLHNDAKNSLKVILQIPLNLKKKEKRMMKIPIQNSSPTLLFSKKFKTKRIKWSI